MFALLLGRVLVPTKTEKQGLRRDILFSVSLKDWI
jgi:hypothetical protein